MQEIEQSSRYNCCIIVRANLKQGPKGDDCLERLKDILGEFGIKDPVIRKLDISESPEDVVKNNDSDVHFLVSSLRADRESLKKGLNGWANLFPGMQDIIRNINQLCITGREKEETLRKKVTAVLSHKSDA